MQFISTINADDRSAIKSFSPSASSATAAAADHFTDPTGGGGGGIAHGLIPLPTVTIMVESPQEAPSSDFPVSTAEQPPPPAAQSTSPDRPANVVIDIDAPIDVNVPRDTTNIFYDYSSDADVDSGRRQRRRSSAHESHTIDMAAAGDRRGRRRPSADLPASSSNGEQSDGGPSS